MRLGDRNWWIIPPRCCLWIVPWNRTFRDLVLDFLHYEICLVELNSVYCLNYRFIFSLKADQFYLRKCLHGFTSQDGTPEGQVVSWPLDARLLGSSRHIITCTLNLVRHVISKNTNSGHQVTWFLKAHHHMHVELGMADDSKNTNRNQATKKIKINLIKLALQQRLSCLDQEQLSNNYRPLDQLWALLWASVSSFFPTLLSSETCLRIFKGNWTWLGNPLVIPWNSAINLIPDLLNSGIFIGFFFRL